MKHDLREDKENTYEKREENLSKTGTENNVFEK